MILASVECEIQHNPADIILTFAIIAGIILSYLPQVNSILNYKNLYLFI